MTRIRPASLRDLPGAYRVCLLTSNADGGSRVWVNEDLLGHVFVGPYFAAPAARAWVAVDAGGVLGYCLGVADSMTFMRWSEQHWWAPLRSEYPADASYPAEESRVVELIHKPESPPAEVLDQYPAHLHIDILERGQGHGLGRRLMTELLASLAADGASGVHLGVAPGNQRAIKFYQHLGFHQVAAEVDVIYLATDL